jgi:NitT/TauT family transport system substrate-binding protein
LAGPRCRVPLGRAPKPNGISPEKVEFITDPKGYPAMPGQLQTGSWRAALLAEPYVTIAEEDYGDQELADTDQGATENFPMDGYVATQAWAEEYPKTAAASCARSRKAS